MARLDIGRDTTPDAAARVRDWVERHVPQTWRERILGLPREPDPYVDAPWREVPCS